MGRIKPDLMGIIGQAQPRGGLTLNPNPSYLLLAMGRYGPGVTYAVPRRATINAPPPVGPLGVLVGCPGAPFSKYPRGGTIPKGGFDTQP